MDRDGSDFDGENRSPGFSKDDEAIEVKEKVPKKRRIVAPDVKKKSNVLNEAKLTSPEGLPALPKLFAKWKPNQKADEFSNVRDCMQLLEQWAHRLYPRARFEDFLTQCEHLGQRRPVKTCMTKLRLGMPLTDDDFAPRATTEGQTEAEQLFDATQADDDDLLLEAVNSVSASTQNEKSKSTDVDLTEEQRKRMEQSRLKAIELRKRKMESGNQSVTQDSTGPGIGDASPNRSENADSSTCPVPYDPAPDDFPDNSGEVFLDEMRAVDDLLYGDD